jgi:hypothetical protein
VGRKKLQNLKLRDSVCDVSVFAAAVLHAVLQSTAARQSVSESIQDGFKFCLTLHKSTFFRPEEAAPWLERYKNTDHRTVDFRGYLLAFVFAG